VSEELAAFNFRVEIVPRGASAPLCDAAFAECEGLELRFDVRAVGGGRLVSGPASCGEVTLRRGMTSSFDLWEWCAAVARDPSLRADARVIVLSRDGASERARFHLARCLPVRLRAPRLDAVDGVVAIEELVLAGESLALGDAGVGGPEAHATLGEPGGRPIAAQINPAKLQLARDGAGQTLHFELWFEAADGARAAVVELAARPMVLFRWGEFAFEGRVTTLVQELDSFAPDGRPRRARLALTMVAGG
jgi:phage tail-like protein